MKRTFWLSSFLILALSGCVDNSVLVHVYDPGQVNPGRTITVVNSSKHFLVFDFNGGVYWDYPEPQIYGIGDFEVLQDTNILHILVGGKPTVTAYPGARLYVGPPQRAHHSISELPWGDFIYVTWEAVSVGGWMDTIQSDNIEILDRDTGEVIWEWKSHEHIDPFACYCPVCINKKWHMGRDWTHGNTVHFYEEQSAILYNPRNLDTLYLISYPEGDILWACGRCGSFGEGLFRHPHDPYILPNGNILMFDNGNHREPPAWSRALEIAIDPELQEAHEVWEYRETPDFFSPSMCDANRLANGNTLITDAWQGRILEVNAQAEKVWEVTIVNKYLGNQPHMMYKAERVPYSFWDGCTDTDGDTYSPEGGDCGPLDCDDANPEVYPGAAELCDGLDNDCDGTIPTEEDDLDGDAYRICQGDCDDGASAVNPGASEICDDGLDNDCDTFVDSQDPDC